MKHQGRRFSFTQVIYVVYLTYTDSIEHQRFLYTGSFGYFLLYTGINFLPETRYATHQSRTNFLNRHLNIHRTEVDAYLYSLMDTEITPSLLEHMSQWQEVHRHIFVRHIHQTNIMNAESFKEARVMQHDSFGLSRRTGSI